MKLQSTGRLPKKNASHLSRVRAVVAIRTTPVQQDWHHGVRAAVPGLLIVALATCLNLSAQTQAVSTEEEEKAMAGLYGSEEMLSIASGYLQPLAKAPSTASVITEADMRAVGATDIDDVLETVPGLHVVRNGQSYSPIYTFRGVHSQLNQQVLMMVNGIPITDLFGGGHTLYWGGMPVEAISRIEVVRGPGSAMYGADAAAGMINIVTKSGQDIKGVEGGVRIGSFNTYDAWGLIGGNRFGFDVAVMVEYHKTDGQRRIIDADLQTLFDTLFGTQVSRAPGAVDLQRDNLDARLDVARGPWRFRAGLQQRKMGMGFGMVGALAPGVHYTSERWNTDLTWHNPKVADNWDVEAQLSYLDHANRADRNNIAFPPGVRLPIGPNGQVDFQSTNLVTFPDGYIGVPDQFARTTRATLSGNYSGFAQHLLRIGGGFNYSTMRVAERKNFGLDPVTGLPINGTRMVDVTGTSAAYLAGEPDRKNYSLYLQDEWKFAQDWTFTGGARYDYFSDFGSTINPRLTLVWETRYDLTTKLMYGRAFRAPSFQDLYSINAPFDFGNPNLKAENMDTVELAFDYRPRHDVRLGWGVFQYRWRDIIGFVPNADGVTTRAQNSGRQTGYGGELEAEWKASTTVTLAGSYSYQKSTNETLGHDAGYAPHHQIGVRANWEFLPNWEISSQAKRIMDRDRAAGDTRPAIADYTWVDLTLRGRKIWERFEVTFSMRNLFDADAREPSTPSSAVTNDLPLAGRSFFGEIRFEF